MRCVEAINGGQHELSECGVIPIENGLILLNPKGISRINGSLFLIEGGREMCWWTRFFTIKQQTH
jgi:hypothetical protein